MLRPQTTPPRPWPSTLHHCCPKRPQGWQDTGGRSCCGGSHLDPAGKGRGASPCSGPPASGTGAQSQSPDGTPAAQRPRGQAGVCRFLHLHPLCREGGQSRGKVAGAGAGGEDHTSTPGRQGGGVASPVEVEAGRHQGSGAWPPGGSRGGGPLASSGQSCTGRGGRTPSVGTQDSPPSGRSGAAVCERPSHLEAGR